MSEDEDEAPPSPELALSEYQLPIVSPAAGLTRRHHWIEFTYSPRRVRFENYETDDENDVNPLKVSAFVFGIPILTEREADYLLSQRIQGWKKLLFLLTNVPYLAVAVLSMFLTKVDHRSFHPSLDFLCESCFAHCALATLVSVTSIGLHTSQVRVGHWCCPASRARTFHRRRVQDRLDLADCTCASLAVILGVLCHGVLEMGWNMALVVPIFLSSIVAKKLKMWNWYLILHGTWHLATAYLLAQIFLPQMSLFS